MENINNQPQNTSETNNNKLYSSLIKIGVIMLTYLPTGSNVQAQPSQIQESANPSVHIETNWATNNPLDYKISKIGLPKPSLRVQSENNGIMIKGTARPARYENLKLHAKVKCNQNQECLKLDKTPGDDTLDIEKNIRTEYVAINVERGGSELGRVWHDSEDHNFQGTVKKFDDKTIVKPENGTYKARVNIFTDFDLKEAGIDKIDLRGSNNTGIHGPWSDSADLNK
jgi:hypothetical protein